MGVMSTTEGVPVVNPYIPSRQRGLAIIEIICARCRVSVADIGDSIRHPRVVIARAVMVHLLRTHTTLGFPDIARMMGRPNHSTVITAYQRIKKQYANDEVVAVAGLDTTTVRKLIDGLDAHITRKLGKQFQVKRVAASPPPQEPPPVAVEPEKPPEPPKQPKQPKPRVVHGYGCQCRPCLELTQLARRIVDRNPEVRPTEMDEMVRPFVKAVLERRGTMGMSA